MGRPLFLIARPTFAIIRITKQERLPLSGFAVRSESPSRTTMFAKQCLLGTRLVSVGDKGTILSTLFCSLIGTRSHRHLTMKSDGCLILIFRRYIKFFFRIIYHNMGIMGILPAAICHYYNGLKFYRLSWNQALITINQKGQPTPQRKESE